MNNYEILGLKKGATLKEIKAKFRELAKKHHPDKGGNQATFVKINNAYEALLKGDSGEVDYGLGGQKQRPYQRQQQPPSDQTSEAYWQYTKTEAYRQAQRQQRRDTQNMQDAYNQSQANFRAEKKNEYRFIGIKKDEKGYFISFHVEGVNHIFIWGKNHDTIGDYNMKGDVGTRNLRISFEDAKKAEYMFRVSIWGDNGGNAKHEYKVTPPIPPKKPTILDKVKNFIDKLW